MKYVRFYKEKKSGDLLFVDVESWTFNKENELLFEGCATCIVGNPNSINWTLIHRDFLEQDCKRISEKEVKKLREYKILYERAKWVSEKRKNNEEPILPY